MDASATATPQTKKHAISETGAYSASALAIGAKLKEFVVTGIIGEGGFGIVYSAQDTLLQRNVAIKEYMPAAIANRQASSKINLRSVRHHQTFAAGMQGFIDEARLLAQFKHPALVEILRFWEANGTAYMVMPHYSGKTLRNILKTSPNLCTERWLKSILGPVLDAIELLHANHVYHRDIAPDNIVVQDTGQPVLLDLGSARRVIAGMQSALTVVVKPGYAPIEQYTEDTANEQGPWTDIYALGAVLYFAISGSAPAASVSRMMRDSLKLLNTEDHPLYSDSFLSAINKALQLRPSDRFQSIAEFRDALNINTSLTGNVSITALIEEPTKSEVKQPNNSHKDDEITLILSEDEISEFKEKLLKSLQPTPANSRLDDNILSNDPAIQKDSSISTFSDVKDILENNHYIANNKTSKNAATNNTLKLEKNSLSNVSNFPNERNTSKSQNNSAPIKPMVNKLSLAIGLFVAISVVAAVIFITAESNESAPQLEKIVTIKATDEENVVSEKTEELPATESSPENTIASLSTLEPALQNAERSPYFASPENIYGDNTQQTITEQINANSNQPIEVLDEFRTTQIQQEVNEPETNSDQGTTQSQDLSAQNNDTQKVSKPIVSTQIKTVKSAAQAIALESVKITLVPWGEIWIDNQRYGVSPPLREILLAPGTYAIELRNPGLPSEIRTIHFNQGDNPSIYHNFSDPKQQPKDDLEKDTIVKTSTEKPRGAQKEDNKKSPSSTNNNTKAQPNDEPIKSGQPITENRLVNIKVIPWGEMYLDGKMVGVTPPLHQLTLAPGTHIIEIRHPSYPTKTIQISPEDPLSETLEHYFQ